MHQFKIIFFSNLLLLAGNSILAQEVEESSVTQQIWLDFNPSYSISDNLALHTPVGARTIFPNAWYRFYVNPHVRYNWPRLILKDMKYREQLLGGVGIYYTANVDDVNRLELRPFQGYSLSAPNRMRLVIKHYLRLEERFELETDDWVNTFGLRFRYSLTGTIRFQGDFWEYGKGFFIPVSGDFFWNLIGTKQFNDKIRLTFGLGRDLAKGWKAAFFLGYNYSRGSTEDDFHTNDIIYRFRVYHKLKTTK